MTFLPFCLTRQLPQFHRGVLLMSPMKFLRSVYYMDVYVAWCLTLFCFHSSLSQSLFSAQCEQPFVHVNTFRTWKEGSDIGINSLLRTIRTQHFSQCGSKWLTTNKQLPLMSILFTHGGRAIVPNFLTSSNGKVTRKFSQVHAKYVSDGKLKYVD